MALLDKLLGRNTMSEVLTAIEVNCATGEVTERPLTAEEITQREADRVAAEARKAEEDAAKAAEETAKASAQAKLSALGLTAEEISALTK
jgi:membrane protein involved in colicin uptake